MENNINKRYKSFTSLEQSKKLAEILPLESADLYYYKYGLPQFIEGQGDYESIKTDKYRDKIPCWSLAALISVLPKFINSGTHYTFLLIYPTQNLRWTVEYSDDNAVVDFYFNYKNLIDACYKMILKLNGLKML